MRQVEACVWVTDQSQINCKYSVNPFLEFEEIRARGNREIWGALENVTPGAQSADGDLIPPVERAQAQAERW